MKSKPFAAGLSGWVLAMFSLALLSPVALSPAAAQTAAPDDLHCFLLSNVFARTEKDDKRRLLAGQATMFYLGRIDGRVNAQALGAAMRTPLVPQTAGAQMTACAQRLGRSEMMMQQTLQSVAPKRNAPSRH